MNDVIVLKATDDLHNCVNFSDIREKLVSESFSFARPLNESRDVDKLNRGGNDHLGFRDLLKNGETLVWYVHNADIGINGAERVVGRLCFAGSSQRIEKRRLANIGETDDTCFEHRRRTTFNRMLLDKTQFW